MSNADLTAESLDVVGMRLVAEMIPNAALKAVWLSALADLESGRSTEDAAAGTAMTASIFRRQTAGGLGVAEQRSLCEQRRPTPAAPGTPHAPPRGARADNQRRHASTPKQVLA